MQPHHQPIPYARDINNILVGLEPRHVLYLVQQLTALLFRLTLKKEPVRYLKNNLFYFIGILLKDNSFTVRKSVIECFKQFSSCRG